MPVAAPALTFQEATDIFIKLPGAHLVHRVNVAPVNKSMDGATLFVWTAQVMLDDGRWHDACFDDHYPNGVAVNRGS